MTRKNYIAIAKALAHTVKHHPESTKAIEHMAGQLLGIFSADNPRFDSRRFLEASNVHNR